MRRMYCDLHSYLHNLIGSLVLSAVIFAPAVVVPTAKAQEASVQVRIYDKDHHDYHNWDDHEDRAYRRYLAEQRRDYIEYKKLNSRDQRAYWNWRHDHPDRDDK
jgi:hypothetical protein